jgi:phosphohistidine phosphatase
MKKLIIVRHSKSSWNDDSLLDFDRPLNKRGNEDGKKMSKLLKKYISSVDLLISSSSKRTRLTSSYFQKEIQFENSLFTKKLYHASYNEIIKKLNEIELGVDSVLLIGHNPGLTEFINKTTNINIFNLPTTGVLIINYEIKNWLELDCKVGKVELIKFPKEI